MVGLTPMMRQYFEIKKDYKDAILMYRLGDFYEMFFEDAKVASRELELVLTGRDCGQEERAPMCGVPFHSADSYIAKLVSRGYKVAICEQMEDPATAKGIVKRGVVRVVTPGTVIERDMLDESKNNFLSSIFYMNKKAGICFTDVSTGAVHLTELDDSGDIEAKLINELGRFCPKEILINIECANLERVKAFILNNLGASIESLPNEIFLCEKCEENVLNYFEAESLQALGLNNSCEAVCALGAALHYLSDVQKTDLQNIKEINFYNESQFMKLDVSSRRNLELCETLRSREKRGSLLWVLDKTKTPMGKRLIRSWTEQPLVNLAQITKRHNAVEELYNQSVLRQDLMISLNEIFDMERLLTRVVYATANAKELKALSCAIKWLPQLKFGIEQCKSELLKNIYDEIDTLDDVAKLIDDAIVDEPPFSVREGGMIKKGFNARLDSFREIVNDGKGFIASIQAQEQERTGIKKLKIGYNRVFGYYIEVLNSYKELVPEEYIRKQTLTNCERYITQELKDLEAKVLGAQERIVGLEYEIFNEIRQKTGEHLYRIQTTAQAVAALDVLCSFAHVAATNSYYRPDMVDSDELHITDGRHPVVELMLKDAPFVPNDTLIDCDENRCVIITGPNMAGKSTYMRQVALITLMAQIGSFVPAKNATIGIVDSIFTRVGASDDLASGQSTFMVEMSEVAQILKNATQKSLIVFDEIGRGTSTFDGMSIARAVLEYAADKKKLGAKTLFATHYHELTELEEQIEGVKNYNIAVKKRGDDITFLRRIVRGGADGSYGIEVAKLAGVPSSVVNRAKKVLKSLESQSGGPVTTTVSSLDEDLDDTQISFASNANNELIEQIKTLDVNTLTPIEALTLLYEFSKLAEKH
ncbi:MAG TPA: DNA mismatch repair protein MutS [Clostridia bacterium]|nr:DNA mismatch repair protein MutS [Clostridia bacterium]